MKITTSVFSPLIWLGLALLIWVLLQDTITNAPTQTLLIRVLFIFGIGFISLALVDATDLMVGAVTRRDNGERTGR